ncbi:hypothetical protein B0T19DRAFT_423655 [Cercophora scortea]|uniref:Zn(2)-C6 fungal-type domain-containing protein n=1 Tax=Cercophora scortea TaxID=314031 RepID=A0AAE0MEG2_9PEZI|nr:hypothetical protein B0T19DRAFT_423655 [Cercophora scortea]
MIYIPGGPALTLDRWLAVRRLRPRIPCRNRYLIFRINPGDLRMARVIPAKKTNERYFIRSNHGRIAAVKNYLPEGVKYLASHAYGDSCSKLPHFSSNKIIIHHQSNKTMARSTSTPSSTKRTRTGCVTCRIRRVKCDETKPECTRCVQGKRTCDGYVPDGASAGKPLTRRELAVVVRKLASVGPVARVLAGPQTPDKVSCFDFFRLRTAPAAGAFFPTEFWSTRILQVAHAESAVWNAALALGALHRRWELQVAADAAGGRYHGDDGCMYARFSAQASVFYGAAMAEARAITDPATLLVLSLALAAVSNLSGGWADSRVHINAGQRLLDTLRRRVGRRRKRYEEIDGITAAFVRLDLQAMTLSDSTAPYPFSVEGGGLSDCAETVDSPGQWSSNTPSTAHSSNPSSVPETPLENLGHAVGVLLDLLRDILMLAARGGELPSEELATRERVIQDELVAWENDMREYMATTRIPNTSDETYQTSLLSLKLYHTATCLMVKARPATGPDSRWDECLAHFERIVAISAALLRLTRAGPAHNLLSLEPGIIIPLYLTATSCRHAVVRRRAIALLRTTKRQEGVWTSYGGAAVAEARMKVEEEGLALPFASPSVGPEFLAGETEAWGDDIVAEDWRYWLGGDEKWRAKSSWEASPRIPERQHVLDTSVKVDTGAGVADVVMILFDPAEGAGIYTREVKVDIGTYQALDGTQYTSRSIPVLEKGRLFAEYPGQERNLVNPGFIGDDGR